MAYSNIESQLWVWVYPWNSIRWSVLAFSGFKFQKQKKQMSGISWPPVLEILVKGTLWPSYHDVEAPEQMENRLSTYPLWEEEDKFPSTNVA